MSVESKPEVPDQETSLFLRNPFKEFTQRKFQELLQHANMERLIKMREQALEARHQTQVDYMNKMLETKRFSPNTFNTKKIELEKWVSKEKKQIQKSKKDIEKGWVRFNEALKKVFISLFLKEC